MSYFKRNMNSGYDGYSMSNRAVDAYEMGQKPKSKWSKQDMLDAIEDACLDMQIVFDPNVRKLKKDALFNIFFRLTSWHHTSRFCNETDFYGLDIDAVEKYMADPNLVKEAISKCKDADAESKKPLTACKARITYEEYKRRWGGYGSWKEYERYCLVIDDWAYCTDGKKNIWGNHILDIEYFEEAPIGTEDIFEDIESNLPTSIAKRLTCSSTISKAS